MKNVCFTGHRNIENTDEINYRLFEVIESLINEGAENFFAGGALGFDTLAEKIVITLREKYPQIRLHLLLPCPPNEQTSSWKINDRTGYDDILRLADTVEICSSHYNVDCMKVRNERLVRNADICICYYCKYRSGTGQTVRMAEKRNIRIINLCR